MRQKIKYILILIISISLIILFIMQYQKKESIINFSRGNVKSEIEINKYGIQGKIVDSLNNSISQVKISLYKTDEITSICEVFTDDTGNFSFNNESVTNFTSGTYQINIEKVGYVGCKIIDIPINAESNQVINLQSITINDGDISQDGEVELSDLINLTDNYSHLEGELTTLQKSMDINKDGYINELDKSLLMQNYGKIVTGKKLDTIDYKIESSLASQVNIGDYVDYQPTQISTSYELPSSCTGCTTKSLQQEKLNWRVLSKDDQTGKVTLIADEPTEATLDVGNAFGYNNVVYLLDDICKNLYSKDGVGQARSIDMEDIQKYSTFDSTTSPKYGTKVVPSCNRNIPKLCMYESGTNCKATSIDRSNNGSTVITLPDTTYGYVSSSNAVFVSIIYTYFSYADASKYIIGIPYEMLVNKEKNKSYWLASRCISASYASNGNAEVVIFNAFYVGEGGIDAKALANSNKNNLSGSKNIMPVVELNENVKTSGKDQNGVWNIEN